VHDFNAGNRTPGGPKGFEAEHGTREPFHDAMVLLDDIIQILGAIYQFRIWLRGINPTIWRRLLVRNDSTITDLHYILQLVMGWTDTHLHTFVIHGKDYGIYHSGGMVFADDPTKVVLREFQFGPDPTIAPSNAK
jgi:hypothetical protein